MRWREVVKWFVKIAGCLAAALVLGLAGLSAFFFIAGRDIDPPDVSDVLPPSVLPIPETENVVPILMTATNQLFLTRDDKYFVNNCYRKNGWDRRLRNRDGSRVLTAEEATTWADCILATNAALFAAFDEATKRPRAQYPADLAFVVDHAWHGSKDPRFWQIWQFESVDAFMYGCLTALRARRLRENGQAEVAVQELLKYGEMFARFSYRLENGCCIVNLRSPVLPVADELVQAAISCELPQETMLAIDESLVRWAKDYRMSFRRMHRQCVLRAKNVMPSWRSLPENPAIPNGSFEWPCSVDVPKWFKTLVNWVGKAIESFPGYQRYLFQPNRTIGELADIIRETELYVYAVPYTAETRMRRRTFVSAHPLDIRWTRRNGCGTATVNCYSSWDATLHCGTSAFVTEATRISIAAARYRRKYGNYPQTLDALVPEFLAEVPRDPFDASKPLGYNVEQGTLHTVGADGSFNGKVRDPRFRYGGLTSPKYRYIRRIDGWPMEVPLKIEVRNK